MSEEHIMKKFINTTNYTIQYFEKISRYNNIKGSNFYLMMRFVTVCIFLALVNFRNSDNHILGYIYMFLGIAITPLFSFILPKYSARRNYKKLMEETGKRELIVTTEISDKITVHNSAGLVKAHHFDQVVTVSRFQGMGIIVFKDRDVIYLDLNGFKSGDPNKAISHVCEQANVKLKDEDR